MASERLQVILELVTGQYKREANEAASATGRIAGEADKASTATGRIGEKMTQVGKIAKVAMAAAVTAAFASFVKGSVEAASALNESINAVEAVFGEASESVLAFGQVAAQVSGLSAREFNQLATNTGALLTNMGFSFQEAGDEAVRLAMRAADMASIFDTDVADALNAINSGLRGESEPLRRFGVSLSDAAVRAKAVEMGLADSSAEVDAHGLALGRLELIYEQTASAQGDFVATSGEVANAARVLAAEYENTQASFGQNTLGAKNFFLSAGSDLLGFINLTGIFGEEAKNAQKQAWLLEDAIWMINEATRSGGDPLDALAEGLLLIAQEGQLTTAQFEAMAVAAGLSRDEFGEFGENLLEMAAAMGLPQEILDELAEAIYGTGAAAGDTGPEIEDLGDEAKTAADKLQLLADNQRAATRAFIDALNPISNAFSALDRMNAAQDRMIGLQEDGEATARDIAEAQFEYAQSLFEAQGALEAIDPSDLEGSIEAIALALGMSDDEARDLLETLGLLDGKNVTTVVNTTYRTTYDKQGMSANDSFGGPRHQGGFVEAGSRQHVLANEIFVPSQSGFVVPAAPTPQGGTSNYTIIVPDAQTATHVESLIRQNHSLTRGGLKGGAR